MELFKSISANIRKIGSQTNRFFLKKERWGYIAGTCVLVVLLMGVYGMREKLAFEVWNLSRNERIATLLSPHDAKLRLEIGSYYFSSTEYDIKKAQKYFEEAIALDERTPSAHYQLARVHFINGNFYDSVQEINQELALYPENKRSYYIRGLVYGYAGDYEGAIADFKEFLAWKPDSWAGHNDLAWVYFKKGDYAASREVAQKGLYSSPANPWLLNSLGIALLNLGETEDAERVLREALNQFELMGPVDWGRAYPGNNPQVYEQGFAHSKESVEFNLSLLEER